MSESDALDERLSAVERALTDGNHDLTDLRDAAALTREVEALSARVDALEDRADELDAATQALRGYVGNVRAVNETVERRADAALAKAEQLESGPRAARPVTCGCDRRRPERAPADADRDGGSDGPPDSADTGPLARLVGTIAEALSGSA